MAKVKKVSKKESLSDSMINYKVPVRGASSFSSNFLVVLLIVASFFLGRLSLEVTNLKADKSKTTETTKTNQPSEPQRPISVQAMKDLAAKIGLNTDQFNSCLDSGKYNSRVNDEVAEGQNLGVSGTPTFFINGLMMVGAQPQSAFEAIIDAELKNGGGAAEAKKLGEDGVRKTLNYGTGYVKGAENAKIKIMEYTDFECPFCERAFPTVEALLAKYDGKISLEYRSFPLPFHSLAAKAAEGALCAGEQGKFWEMHDMMFAPSK